MMAATSGVQEAIHDANTAYSEARAYVASIPEKRMLIANRVGVWSGKDLVVHLGILEREGARLIRDVAAGRPETWLPEGAELDAWNMEQVNEHAALSLDEALRFWDDQHRELNATYEAARADRPELLLMATRDHYRVHYPDFRHIKPFKTLSAEQRRDLLDDMENSHRDFRVMIDGIPSAALERPNMVGVWSGKDLIAHLGHWQEAAADLVRRLENDQPGKWPGEDGNDINEWNQARVDETRSLSLSEIKDYQQQAYEELYALIEASPKATRSAGIGGTRFHYDIHREDFERIANS